MYGGLTLLNNETLYDRFQRAQEPQRLELLYEMARRIGTSGAMLLPEYREDLTFRASIDGDTIRLFKKYKLTDGQNDTY